MSSSHLMQKPAGTLWWLAWDARRHLGVEHVAWPAVWHTQRGGVGGVARGAAMAAMHPCQDRRRAHAPDDAVGEDGLGEVDHDPLGGSGGRRQRVLRAVCCPRSGSVAHRRGEAGGLALGVLLLLLQPVWRSEQQLPFRGLHALLACPRPGGCAHARARAVWCVQRIVSCQLHMVRAGAARTHRAVRLVSCQGRVVGGRQHSAVHRQLREGGGGCG